MRAESRIKAVTSRLLCFKSPLRPLGEESLGQGQKIWVETAEE